VYRGALLQGRTDRAVETVLEVKSTSPLDHVREEVSVEGRVLVEQHIKREYALRRDELVEPDLARRYGCPVPLAKAVLGVRATVSDQLEDHQHLLLEGETFVD
jgi:hypothetical protein